MDILKIKQFLNDNVDNRGDGSGDVYSCYGYGRGTGRGDGRGRGTGGRYDFGNSRGDGYCYDYCYSYDNYYGNGDGNGDGYGRGYGDSSGIKSINGHDIYRVDDTPTIFTYIHGNIAKGYVLERNVILKPCYIVKGNGYFSHGETLRKAQSSLEEKILDDMDINEKIELFKENFSDVNKKYPVKDFYQWHHNLTGSCEMGRKTFARSHNIDIENDMMTVKEFMDLTENAYCGEIIKDLKESYKNGKSNTV